MKQLSYCSRRCRQGITSPPLTGIEPNPGPKTGAKRKSKKQQSPETPKKPKQPSSIHISPEQRDELKDLLLSGRTQESVIREGKFSKKTVSRMAKRLKETQTTPPKDQKPGSVDEEKKKRPLRTSCFFLVPLSRSPHEKYGFTIFGVLFDCQGRYA